jgi:hypothetical protein
MDGRAPLFESSVPLRGLTVHCDIEVKRSPERRRERERREERTF